MASFIDAFRDGMAAAKTVRENFREVQRVLLHLKEEVFIETSGRVSVRICRLVSKDKLNWSTLEDTLKLRKDDVHYYAICADNPQVQDSLIELARWEQDKTGYPCRITTEGRVFHCDNRDKLEAGLQEMLRQTENGMRIARLMSGASSPSPSPSSSSSSPREAEEPLQGENQNQKGRLVRRTKRVRVPQK